jgi:hypothetical protein
MLIVGTRGRSLGGIQGLMSNRNSFSKWCLQYSPVPVVVLRPTEKREKKKKKRDADPTRQDYARILKESGIEGHETGVSIDGRKFDAPNTPIMEAIAVAAAVGLPGGFDPLLRPVVVDDAVPLDGNPLQQTETAESDKSTGSSDSTSPDSRPTSPNTVIKTPKSPIVDDQESQSGEESSDDEGEFEVMSGHALLGNGVERPEEERKKKLHDMECAEAAAFSSGRNFSVGSVDSEVGGGRKVSVESVDSEVGGANIKEEKEDGEDDESDEK